jgi:hypothetical protein
MLKPILKQIKFAKKLVVYADYITVVFDWAMYICIRQNFFLSFHGKILAPLARFMREPRIITKDRCLIASEYSDVSSLYTRSIHFWWFLFDKKGERLSAHADENSDVSWMDLDHMYLRIVATVS